MKVIIAFAILITGITAVPQPERNIHIDFRDERLVSGQIESAIADLSQAIRDAGLDPFHIKKENFSFELPVPSIFNVVAFVEDILSTGLSDIKVNNINYSVLRSRLDFDIELPLLHFSAGSALAEVTVLSKKFDFSASGKLEIQRIRVVGQVRINIGIISGISIRSLNIDVTLQGINSDVNLVLFGKDYSDFFNELVGSTIPDAIQAHHSEINELLEIILMQLLDSIM